MRQHIICISFVCLGLSLFSGCQKESEEVIAIKHLLESFMSREINFPEKVVVFEKGTVMLKEMPVFQEPVLVYFMGFKDCFECEIAHLHDLVPIFQIAEKDPRFHTFLLDENKHPFLVGDPLSSKKMMKLFNKTLNNH